MKAAAAILLMLLFSVQTFSTWLWVLDYQVNKAYIAKNRCINKARPQLHCNGKCQLAKKLAEEEKRNTAGNTSLKENSTTVFCRQELEALLFSFQSLRLKHNTIYLIQACTSERTPVFHPPAV
jgi:hypothetical protein